MTADEYFQAFLQRNPVIAANEIVQLPSRSIRAIIFQAHAEGVKEGRKTESRNSLDAIFNGDSSK